MEKSANVLYLGDICTNIIFETLRKKLLSRYSSEKGYDLSLEKLVLTDGLKSQVKDDILKRYQVVVVNLGLLDCIEKNTFDKASYEKIIMKLKKNGCRVILCTLPPTKNVKRYNKQIIEIAVKYQFRIANISLYWKYEKKYKPRLKDGKYNDDAVMMSIKAIIPVLIRTKMLVLWQYNGRYAHCNYACPYCYVATSVNKGMHIVYDLDKWEKAFEKHFGDMDTVFYFSYGEPTMGGKAFYEVLEMIARHPNWQARMTSNVSINLDKLLNTTLAKEGRLNINASFHPTQVSIERFIEQCNKIRGAGIEPSIIYVMYPEQVDDFETKYMPMFRKYNYRVHIRAFRGLYHGKKYPQMYTREQWLKVAKYMDMGNFKYQLPAVMGLGRLSMLGVSHILVDNYGKIEMCDSYVGDRHYGNVFDNEIHLDLEPHAFPGLVPLAAVDDIADYVELDYDDLENNNVNDFNTQGNTVVTPEGTISYPLEHYDLTDKTKVRELQRVPKPFMPAYRYWLHPKWFCQHFIYSFVIKKYGKYVWAWARGKYSLLRAGKLSLKNFWHS